MAAHGDMALYRQKGYMYPNVKSLEAIQDVMSKQTAIRLPDETHARLHALAARTGRPAAFYIRQALERHLEDLEDACLADSVIERIRSGDERTFSLEEVERDLGLEH